MKLNLKQIREEFGYTQMELAHKSGVSLPTIQNIESGKTNPGLAIADKLLSVLGFHLHIKSQAVDWDLLATLGAPLVSLKTNHFKPSADLLRKNLLLALRTLKNNPEEPQRERKQEALQALILGIQTHFPTFYKKLSSQPLVKWATEISLTPKVIKLKRQSVEILSKYL